MNQLDRIGGRERQGARQKFVECDAKRVQIAARVGRAVHAAGLLRRHVGVGASDDVRRLGRLMLSGQA